MIDHLNFDTNSCLQQRNVTVVNENRVWSIIWMVWTKVLEQLMDVSSTSITGVPFQSDHSSTYSLIFSFFFLLSALLFWVFSLIFLSCLDQRNVFDLVSRAQVFQKFIYKQMGKLLLLKRRLNLSALRLLSFSTFFYFYPLPNFTYIVFLKYQVTWVLKCSNSI